MCLLLRICFQLQDAVRWVWWLEQPKLKSLIRNMTRADYCSSKRV